MNRMDLPRLSFILLLATAASACSFSPGSAPSNRGYIIPASYTATPGQGRESTGMYDYLDETGSQLIDGRLGGDRITEDLGNGVAYEWVGWWEKVDPAIRFVFQGNVSIGTVEIGFNHDEGLGIFLPGTVVVDGKTQQVNGTAIANGKRGFVSIDCSFTGSELEISLVHRGPGWVFVDEVRFR